jgi:putative DNA primase/helicase
MTDRTMPNSEDAERTILGAILLDNHACNEAAESLTPDDFYQDANRKIFAAMLALHSAGVAIDTVTLPAELSSRKQLEQVRGVPYISSLIDGVPHQPSIAQYIKIVKDGAARRHAAKIGETLQRQAGDPSVPTLALGGLAQELSEVGSDAAPLPPRFSEDSLALRFSQRYANDLRYVAAWGRWLCWDGGRWGEDSTLEVYDRVRDICRAASAESTEKPVSSRLASGATVASVEKLARADRSHAATIDQWDSDPWILNTPTGIVDLRTGELHPHSPTRYLTKMTAAGPDGECPLWLRFLDRVTDGNQELQSFLQRVIGYGLTGSTREHAIFFMYGTGANGKSVFLSTIAQLLGDYAKTAPVSAFTATTVEQHPTDMAGLRGARFVSAIETEDGKWWAESKIKSLTGGDRISARFMRQDFFDFLPQFKLCVAGNHKPGLKSVDEAIRRRMHLIPFTVTIPEHERDPELTEKLKAEFPAILQWAIQGCLAWQREGLNAPSIVKDATADYMAAEDAIGRWLDDRCQVGSRHWAASSVLYTDYKMWCDRSGEREGSQKRFSQALEARGYAPERTRAVKGFVGLALRADVQASEMESVPDVPGRPILHV